MNTGFKNVILSMLAVTVLARPECLFATSPAIRSTCFNMTPPKTLPFGFASVGNIMIVISAWDSAGLFPGLSGDAIFNTCTNYHN
jgi:hypothetical protein